MKFKYDIKKSEQLRKNPKRGVGFNDVQELFEHYYYEDLRFDNEGLYYHLVTLWKATKQEVRNYAENS